MYTSISTCCPAVGYPAGTCTLTLVPPLTCESTLISKYCCDVGAFGGGGAACLCFWCFVFEIWSRVIQSIYIYYICIHIYIMSQVTYWLLTEWWEQGTWVVSCVCMSHVAHVKKLCHTYERASPMTKSFHNWKRHIPCERVMSRIDESCHMLMWYCKAQPVSRRHVAWRRWIKETILKRQLCNYCTQ